MCFVVDLFTCLYVWYLSVETAHTGSVLAELWSFCRGQFKAGPCSCQVACS